LPKEILAEPAVTALLSPGTDHPSFVFVNLEGFTRAGDGNAGLFIKLRTFIVRKAGAKKRFYLTF